jgi:RNA-directed DNA polymerase
MPLGGLSRKGPYRLAKTLATQSGMTNKWLKDQGLLSVKEPWVNSISRLRLGSSWEPA